MSVKCNYCEWGCDLGNGKYGVCRMYLEEKGVVKERFPNRWCGYGASGIESIPFYHAYPGSKCMTIGTSSCNLSCQYCSNAHIAKEDPESLQDKMFDLSPGEMIRIAGRSGCQSIIFSVNEPTVSLPSLVELGKAAKAAGLPMGCLTNGYMTEEATEIMASIFSFFNISLKGFSSEFYQHYMGVPRVDPILRNIRRLAETHHVEVITPVIQSANDHELDQVAEFLAGIDREIPWHVFRLLPEHEMKNEERPNVEATSKILDSARKRLSYVYFHNFIGSDWVNTICPSCGAEVMERFSLGCACGGDRLMTNLCEDNRCPRCHHEIRMLAYVGSKIAVGARL